MCKMWYKSVIAVCVYTYYITIIIYDVIIQHAYSVRPLDLREQNGEKNEKDFGYAVNNSYVSNNACRMWQKV